MPRPDRSHPANAPGPWYVDNRCIRCDAARNWAPETIGMDETGRSLIRRQPTTDAEAAALWRAAAACPTKSIGNRDFPREPAGVFPYELAAGSMPWAAMPWPLSPPIPFWRSVPRAT